jgi:transcriptional regulator with GAF, ATPase, and Fis domain
MSTHETSWERSVIQPDEIEPVGLDAAEARRADDVLARAVRGLRERAGFAFAQIWLAGLGDRCDACPLRDACPDRTLCLHRAAIDAGDANAAPLAERAPLGRGSLGQVATRGTALCGRVADDPVDRACFGADPFLALQPLVFRGESMGVLGVGAKESIGADAHARLASFAAHLAIAIAHARTADERVRQQRQLTRERDLLREDLEHALGHGPLVAESAAGRKLREQIELCAPIDACVLILGEAGTGKRRVAHAVHAASGRADAPLVPVECGTVTPERFAERAALAEHGTLLLRDVEALPRFAQRAALRAEARIVATTRSHLRAVVAAGRFDAALYHHLSVFPIEVAPLRERREDIAPLARHFLRCAARRCGRPEPHLSTDDLRALEARAWPGNVRELAETLERAVRASSGARLALDAAEAIGSPRARGVETEAQLRQRERDNLRSALAAAGGRVYGARGAAALLGVRPTTLASRLRALGIDRARLAAQKRSDGQ